MERQEILVWADLIHERFDLDVLNRERILVI